MAAENRSPENEKCWCGGEVGRREPGDENGNGCLENIYHDWSLKPEIKVESLCGCVCFTCRHLDHCHGVYCDE